MVFNFTVARGIGWAKRERMAEISWLLLSFAVGANLLLLIYYKYMNFLLTSFGGDWGSDFAIVKSLPLGISFFTFTQIAYLVDMYRGEAKPFKPVHYGLFVTYFPHLIAGPILHHREMMSQFTSPKTYRFVHQNIAVGITIFVIGLVKKLFFADPISQFVGPVFSANAMHLTAPEAWGGALAYTLQIYFDFSGYSDMAIGLSRLFGIRLPLNFHSPYKSTNIVDFWRRWHMTLSRFLRDYLYIPLGGNRKGPLRRYFNLLATMVLGGLWHGAGWTFIAWGALHGFYLILNHGWQNLKGGLTRRHSFGPGFGRFAGRTVTFVAVVIAWVFFRASNMNEALNILQGMAGMHGLSLPTNPIGGSSDQVWMTLGLLLVAWTMPNTQEWMAAFDPCVESVVESTDSLKIAIWRPAFWSALLIGGAFVFCILKMRSSPNLEFIYYNF